MPATSSIADVAYRNGLIARLFISHGTEFFVAFQRYVGRPLISHTCENSYSQLPYGESSVKSTGMDLGLN